VPRKPERLPANTTLRARKRHGKTLRGRVTSRDAVVSTKEKVGPQRDCSTKKGRGNSTPPKDTRENTVFIKRERYNREEHWGGKRKSKAYSRGQQKKKGGKDREERGESRKTQGVGERKVNGESTPCYKEYEGGCEPWGRKPRRGDPTF